MGAGRCIDCGRCCHYYINGEFKKCKHLRYDDDNKSYCKVYKKRFRKIIDLDKKTNKKVICLLRKDSPFNYEGCPYNNKGKPVFPMKELK